ncbi:MAG: hypothetical protein QM811_16975 [Pirellulales bacterium]
MLRRQFDRFAARQFRQRPRAPSSPYAPINEAVISGPCFIIASAASSPTVEANFSAAGLRTIRSASSPYLDINASDLPPYSPASSANFNACGPTLRAADNASSPCLATSFSSCTVSFSVPSSATSLPNFFVRNSIVSRIAPLVTPARAG